MKSITEDLFDVDKANEEIKKAGYSIFNLETEEEVPKEVINTFKRISVFVKDSKYYKDSYSIICIKEYIPFSGQVFRLFVLEDANIDIGIKIKTEIGKKQILSIYYDNVNALALMDNPYYEIYDGSDIERFFESETVALTSKALKILKEKY